MQLILLLDGEKRIYYNMPALYPQERNDSRKENLIWKRKRRKLLAWDC